MLLQIAYFQILGKPLIMWGGLITFILMVIAAAMPMLGRKGLIKNSLIWHKRLAKIAIILALLHGILGLASYF